MDMHMCTKDTVVTDQKSQNLDLTACSVFLVDNEPY